ncbi:NADH-quinone oxidoreductase subunit G [Bacilli bacterium PM5-3]|nr:NADH-quinone oxidoreductase subunit G [Bacilli bacterium PM5-3]MDH6604243.1 NADH-quinone oxidoreductase subunit G [Bacilli bacterium PM5-9]
MLSVNINGKTFEAEANETILEVAKRNGYHIPTLCHLNLHDMDYCNHPVSCRICMVEVEDARGSRLVPSCDTFVADGMKISTDSKESINARRTVMELLLSNHPQDCLYCSRSTNCDLQELAYELNIRGNRFEGKKSDFGIDDSSRSIVKDLDKCILCRRCETICSEVQTVDVYSAVNRGFDTVIAPAFNDSLQNTACTFCGQCVSVCPTGALTEISHVDSLWSALNDEEKIVVVQTAPAVRVAIAEEFGAEPGTISTGKMVNSLKRIGFDYVFDTNWGADLTIMEEAHEVLERINGNGRLPILTSCCPAWIKFIEHQFPSLIDIPSTCKSPHEMFGAITKTYWAEKMGVDPKKIYVASIMPCVAKKYEAARPELSVDSKDDVDCVITTRELALMIKEAGINYMQLDDCEFDNPLGESTGAGAIFGATGGVLEAALRTVSAWLSDEKAPSLDFKDVRGLEGIKEACVNVGGTEVKVAAAHGLGNARKLLEKIESGENEYHIIEIMACPGGCIAGGGQPYHHGDRSIISKRMDAIYDIDVHKTIRESHKNPDIIKIYDEFLGKPGGEMSHKLLHTQFVEREVVEKETEAE